MFEKVEDCPICYAIQRHIVTWIQNSMNWILMWVMRWQYNEIYLIAKLSHSLYLRFSCILITYNINDMRQKCHQWRNLHISNSQNYLRLLCLIITKHKKKRKKKKQLISHLFILSFMVFIHRKEHSHTIFSQSVYTWIKLLSQNEHTLHIPIQI